jgi:hypothetical protein
MWGPPVIRRPGHYKPPRSAGSASSPAFSERLSNSTPGSPGSRHLLKIASFCRHESPGAGPALCPFLFPAAGSLGVGEFALECHHRGIDSYPAIGS